MRIVLPVAGFAVCILIVFPTWKTIDWVEKEARNKALWPALGSLFYVFSAGASLYMNPEGWYRFGLNIFAVIIFVWIAVSFWINNSPPSKSSDR